MKTKTKKKILQREMKRDPFYGMDARTIEIMKRANSREGKGIGKARNKKDRED